MLSVMVAGKPEDLLDELSSDLAVPLPDPFSAEWISTPSLGMANWLKQQLSLRLGATHGQDGIVANIEMEFPSSLRRKLISSHRSAHSGPGLHDPWKVEELTWSVLEVLANSPQAIDPTLANFAAGSGQMARAMAIAALFDSYNLHRPEMVLNWVLGSDCGPDGQPLDSSQLWQPRLLRRIRQHIAATRGAEQTPAEAFKEVLEQLRSGVMVAGSGPHALPSRLFVFAQSALSGDFGPLVEALAVSRDVKVLLHSPSPKMTRRVAHWAAGEVPDGAPERTVPGGGSTWSFPRAGTQSLRAGHPLTQTWGRLQLDSALLLGAGGIVPELGRSELRPTDPSDLTRPDRRGAKGPTLLELIQHRINADQVDGPLGDLDVGLAAEDNSIRIHAASGATRQVEVLRDQLLELLNLDPMLSEDEIVILCPRIDLYSPVITAVLGESAPRGSQPIPGRVPALRYTLVEQNTGAVNPLLGALAELLDLVPSRFTYSGIGSMLRSEAVQLRFGLVEEDLQILDVLGGAGRVRWGLDGEHRADWGIDPDYGLNSWAWGIDQLMMGVALGDDLRLAPLPGQEPHVDPQVHTALAVGGVPPLALGEGSIAAAGRIGAAVKALQGVHRLLGDGLDRTIEDWCERLRTVVDLMLEPARFQEWQRIALDKALDSLICESRDLAGDPSSLKVGFADFRRLISPVIEGRRARVNMAHGTVRVSRPGIFAGVPHKVVCLLGLDADSLPTATTASDNLADSSEWVGDQDARLRARADLLAAVMSARSHLVVTYTGTDVRNNQPVPPAVVLEEFTEELASCLGVTPGQVREESLGIFVTHSRQAFDSKNFVIGDQRLRPLSYDPVALQGALARTLAGQGQLEARPILLDHALDLPAAEPGVVDLAELLSFYSHPVKAFFNTSLGVKLQERSDGQDEELPTSISGLDTASIGRALLSAGLMADDLDKILISIDSDFEFGGLELSRILEVPLATGVLPPPAIADRELPAISEEVAELLHFAESLNVRRATTCSQPIDIRLPSGVRLLGSVEDCLDGPLPGPIDIRFARARPFHRIRQGIQLLALTANDPTTIWRGVLITRGARTGAKSVQIVRTVLGHEVAIRQEVAMDALDALIAQYRDGLSCALPLFDNTSMARSNGSSISSPWGTAHGKYAQGESTDPYHKQAFGTLQTADLTQLSVAGFTLDSEAKRLWGTIDSAIVDPAVNDPELSDSTIGEG